MTKFFNKFKKLCFCLFLVYFPNFESKKKLFRKITSYEFLAPCQNLEKTNNTIPRKLQDRRKDGGTDRPYFIRPFWLPPGSNRIKEFYKKPLKSKPILAQCSISIPPENVRKPTLLFYTPENARKQRFSGGIKMEYWAIIG